MEGMFDWDMAISMLTMEEYFIRTKLLEKKVFNQNQLDDMPVVTAVDGECAVCMEVFEAEAAAKRLPCEHVFHSDCISRWVSDHNSCPLCRSAVFSATGAGAGAEDQS